MRNTFLTQYFLHYSSNRKSYFMVKVGLFMVFSVFCGQVFSQKKVTALISTYDSVLQREELSNSSVYIDSL
ncbi:MAG TPA: hypothetical protein PJ990_10315, partial [Saprospiraceae bacterium]|nr:hypothetical protein [Saprospiraceae bacterium]